MSALLAAAPAAPAAPAAGITAGLILLAFAWVVLYGSMRGYDYSFGALVRKLADMVDDIWLVGGKLADALRAMDYFVMARMADGLDELEEQMSRLWYGLTWIVRETGHALEAFGADVQAAIEGIVGGDIPAQVGAATRPLSDAIGAFRKGLRRYVEDELARFRNGIDGLRRDFTREALARAHGIDDVRGLVATVVLPRIRGIDETLADLKAWARRILGTRVTNLEKALAAGALGAVAIAAITRVFPYWQCTNVRRFNRSLCRMPIGFLDDLLGLAGAVVLLSDVCRLSAIVREGAELLLPALLEVVAVADAAIECTSFPTPPDLPLRSASVPQPSSALAL